VALIIISTRTRILRTLILKISVARIDSFSELNARACPVTGGFVWVIFLVMLLMVLNLVYSISSLLGEQPLFEKIAILHIYVFYVGILSIFAQIVCIYSDS